MNKREREVIKLELTKEDNTIKALERQYRNALRDIDDKIRILQSDELTQSRIYQIQYQKALRGQVEGILDKLHGDQYATIQQYLHDSYQDGYIGTMYSIHGQGIPLIIPLDQDAAVKAIITDSKLSDKLYDEIGVNIKQLKQAVSSEITRGIATNMPFADIARNIANRSKAPLSRAKTIVRTESHRIQQAAANDARDAAKDRGCDVVKQWDGTLDGDTRPTHRRLDGQIRETNEPFEMDGKTAMYPGDFGKPEEDCNCRCVALTRAKWALDEDELKTLKERAEYFKLDKKDDFATFEEKYLKATEKVAEAPKFVPAKTIEEAEAYAERFVEKYKSSITGNVSYKGLDLEYANALNRSMTEVFDKYETRYPLRNIKPFNFREKRFKDSTADAAYQWGSRDLFFNPKYYKNKKTFDAHKKEIDGLMDTVLGGVDKLLAGNNLHPVKRRYLEALKKSGVQCFAQKTDDFVGATFIHEIGHYLDDDMFFRAIKAKGIDMSASLDKYASGISGYATASRQEYVAESFTAFWHGRADLCDPDLVEVFKGAMKQ
jgi:hypothetical protein